MITQLRPSLKAKLWRALRSFICGLQLCTHSTLAPDLFISVSYTLPDVGTLCLGTDTALQMWPRTCLVIISFSNNHWDAGWTQLSLLSPDLFWSSCLSTMGLCPLAKESLLSTLGSQPTFPCTAVHFHNSLMWPHILQNFKEKQNFHLH